MKTESDPSWNGTFTMYGETANTTKYSFVFGSDISNIIRSDFPNHVFQIFLRDRLDYFDLLKEEFGFFVIAKGYSDLLRSIKLLPGRLSVLEPHCFSNEQDFFKIASARVGNLGNDYWVRNMKSPYYTYSIDSPFYLSSKNGQTLDNETEPHLELDSMKRFLESLGIPGSIEEVITYARFHVPRILPARITKHEGEKKKKERFLGIPFIGG